MSKRKVLVVDDDLVWLSLTQAWLKLAGYDVIARDSSLGTAAVIEAERPDFILLDVHMPGLRGDALAALITSKGDKDRPFVVLVSGNDVEETRDLARKVGAFGAVHKNPDRKLFLLELERCFAARNPQRDAST